MGATIVVHEDQQSYDNAMESIRNRTYESDYQKRLQQMTVSTASNSESCRQAAQQLLNQEVF